MSEGSLQPDGGWKAEAGSPHRSLTKEEVDDLKKMARESRPLTDKAFIGLIRETKEAKDVDSMEKHLGNP
jgi:hypothetical protein